MSLAGATIRPRQRLAWRLALALLLVLTPLLAGAQAPVGQSVDVPVTGMQMPCHGATADADVSADPAPACPHCSDASIAGQCDCCDQAAPAGISTVSVSTHSDFSGVDCYPPARPGPPPTNPLYAPFRPPIQIS